MEIHGNVEKQTLDMLVGVPCHGEDPFFLIQLLESLTRQENLPYDANIGVAVVVNRTKSSSQAVDDLNTQVIELLKPWVNGGETSLDKIKNAIFLLQSKYGSKYSLPDYADPRNIDQIIQLQYKISERFHLILVDASSGEHALPACNVGIVRNMIAQMADDYLKSPESWIVMTDADSMLSTGYLGTIVTLDDSVKAVTGPVRYFSYDFDPTEWRRANYFDEFLSSVTNMQEDLIKLLRMRVTNDFLQNAMPGANMAFRLGASKAVGGIPALAGGEDSLFSARLLGKDIKIHGHPDLEIFTHARPSDRTDSRCSFGGSVQRRINAPDWNKYPIDSMDLVSLREELFWLIFSLNESKDNSECWISSVQLQIDCTREEAEELYRLNDEVAKNVWPMLNIALLHKTNEILYRKKPQVPLKEALDDIEQMVRNGLGHIDATLQRQFCAGLDKIVEISTLFSKKRKVVLAIMEERFFGNSLRAKQWIRKHQWFDFHDDQTSNGFVRERIEMLRSYVILFYYYLQFWNTLQFFQEKGDEFSELCEKIRDAMASSINVMIMNYIKQCEERYVNLHNEIKKDIDTWLFGNKKEGKRIKEILREATTNMAFDFPGLLDRIKDTKKQFSDTASQKALETYLASTENFCTYLD